MIANLDMISDCDRSNERQMYAEDGETAIIVELLGDPQHKCEENLEMFLKGWR